MPDIGLVVTLRAREGQEGNVREMLRGVLPDVRAETGTPVWMAVQTDASTFLIVDAHRNEVDRQAHLGGTAAAAILARADELLTGPPEILTSTVIGLKT